jgi:hypothetical protein
MCRGKVAVDFIGRDVYEFFDIELAGDLEKDERAGNIRFNRGRRIIDAAVDVRFGCEVNDRLAPCHCGCDGGRIANVALDESVLRIVRDGIQLREVSGVG